MATTLSKAQLAAIHTATVEARGLPGDLYVSRDWGETERNTVLANTWTCLGFTKGLPPSHAQPAELLGLPLVIVRAPDGAVRVFHNVCRHRGHKLIAAPCSLTGAIRCPYHSWTYGLDGTLRGTPHIGGHGVHDADGFDRASHGLFEVRCHVWLDMVFVNLSGDAPSFDEFIAPLESRWEAFTGRGGLAQLRPAEADPEMTIQVAANWKLAVENYCESYHLPWIHPGLNSYSKISDHYNIMGDDWGAGQGSYVFEFSERAGISLPEFGDWPKDKRKVAEYIALFPNVLLGLQVDHLFSMVLLPIAHDRTLEFVQIYYVGEVATGAQFSDARKTLLDGWREVFQEDVGVVEGMQAGRISIAFDGGAFSPVLDVPTHHFHKWVADRLPVDAE